MKNSITRFVIQNDDVDYTDMLHRHLFDVNMRIFKENKQYRRLILSMVRYMVRVLETKFDDYDTAKGISGANVGIPYNIIAIKTDSGEPRVFINPIVIDHSEETFKAKSNCGSLRLSKKVTVERYKRIQIEYFDEKGTIKEEKFEGSEGSTIQHEIDHNMGILIIDKQRES